MLKCHAAAWSLRASPLNWALTGKMEMPKASEQKEFANVSLWTVSSDLCGAWEQPTTATREACGFFMLRKPARNVKTPNEE